MYRNTIKASFPAALIMTGFLLGSHVPPAAAGDDQAQATLVDSETGETTNKHRDPAKAHTPDRDAQVTLGGAQYFLEGDIAKIDADYYFVRKDETGEQIRLLVNADTNLDCGAMPESRARDARKSSSAESGAMTSERLSPTQEAPQASEQQLEQGQRKDETARGSGFRIGQCAFQKGDHVKAEVDDNGRVTTLKYLARTPALAPRSTGPSAGIGELAIPGRQDRPAELDMTGAQGFPPKEYAVVPLRLGKLQPATDNPYLSITVLDMHGKHVGSIDSLLADTATGRIEYAVILVAHTAHHLHPIPWAAMKLRTGKNGENNGEMVAIVDTDQHRLHPNVSLEDSVDLSPSVKSLVKKTEILRAHEEKKAAQRPIERGSVGPHGEALLGGAGPSGFAGPPPGPAPGFEQEKDRP